MSASLTLHQFAPNASIGERFLVLEYRGTERVSEPFSYDVHCLFYHHVYDFAGRAQVFFDALDTTQATITITTPVGSGDGTSRSIRGYVYDYAVLSTNIDPTELQLPLTRSATSPYRSFTLLRITIRPMLSLLDLRPHFRAFVGETTQQIVTYLLEELQVSIINPDDANGAAFGQYHSASNSRLVISQAAATNPFFIKRLRFVLQHSESSLNLMKRLLDNAGLRFIVRSDTAGEFVYIFQYDESFESNSVALTTGSSTVSGQDQITLLTRRYVHETVPAAVEVISQFAGDPANPVFAQQAVETDKNTSSATLVIDDFAVERFVLNEAERNREGYQALVNTRLAHEHARYSADNSLYTLSSNQFVLTTGNDYAITQGARTLQVTTISQEMSGRTDDFTQAQSEIESVTSLLSEDVYQVRASLLDSSVSYLPQPTYERRVANLSITGFIHAVPTGSTFTTTEQWLAEAAPSADGQYDIVASDVILIYEGSNVFDASSYDFATIHAVPSGAAASMPQLTDFTSPNLGAGMQFLLHNGTHVSIEFIDGNPELPFISGIISSPVINQQDAQLADYEDNLRFDHVYQMQTNAGNLLRMNTAVGNPAIELRSPVVRKDTVTASNGTATITMNRLDYSDIRAVSGSGPAAAYLSAETTGMFQKIVLGGQQRTVLAANETVSNGYGGRFGFMQALHPSIVLEGYHRFDTRPLEVFYVGESTNSIRANTKFLSYAPTVSSDTEFDGDFLFDRDIGDVYTYQEGVKYVWHNQNDRYRRGCAENVYFSRLSSETGTLTDDDMAFSVTASNSGESIGVMTDQGKTNNDRYYVDYFRHVWGSALFACSGPAAHEVHGKHTITTQNAYAHAQTSTITTYGDISCISDHLNEFEIFVMREEEISELCHFGTIISAAYQGDDKYYFSLMGVHVHLTEAYFNGIGNDGSLTVGLYMLGALNYMEASTYHGEKAILDSLGIVTQLVGLAIKATAFPIKLAAKGVGMGMAAVASKNSANNMVLPSAPPPPPGPVA